MILSKLPLRLLLLGLAVSLAHPALAQQRPKINNPLGSRPLRTPPPKVDDSPGGPAAATRPDEEDAADARRRKDFKRRNVPVKLDFDRADIMEVVKTISDLTGKNFIVPDNIRGKITILSPTAVKPDEAYSAFLASLEANNLTVYPAGKFLKIIPKKDSPRSNVRTVVGPDGYVPFNEEMVTRIFRFEHIEVDQIQNIVKGLVSRDGNSEPFPPDLMIVTDTGLNIHRIEKIVDQLDRSGGADEIRIIQVKYAEATEIAGKLMEIFEGSGGGGSNNRNPRVNRGRARPANQNKGGEDALDAVNISRVIADERTNKLIVIADEKSFKKIRELLDEIDIPTEGEGQVHVHYLTNADAEELASTLSNLTSGTSTQRPGRPRPNQANTEAGPAELFSGDVKITSDKGTNSLVIVSSYNDYKSVARVIEKLDIPRRQVFVEAVIMEVSLDTSNEFGLTFHQGAAPTVGSGDVAPVIVGTQLGGLNSLSLGSLLGFGGFLAGIQGPPVPGTEDLGVSVPSFGVVLHALQRDSHVNVLSTPHILTSDNEEAEITVGQNVPFQAGFAPQGLSSALGGALGGQDATAALGGLSGFSGLSGLGSFFAPIQRQNVELKLKIEPQINESDYVRLAIEEQTEEIASTDRQLGPTTARRTAKTTVVAKDGQTVVIGGLIQERSVESVQKVPILGDIPVVGWLFRNTETKTIKTNLLLFLTPYIIKDEVDFRRIFERKLEERKQFVEQFYGREDSFENQIDWTRKRGPLADLRDTIREEMSQPENGGSSGTVITPAPAPVREDAPADEADPADDAPPSDGAAPEGETAEAPIDEDIPA